MSSAEHRMGYTVRAARAMFRARRMLAVAIAAIVTELRASSDVMTELYSRKLEDNLRFSQQDELIGLLQARMSRIESRHRNHYSPAERFRILTYKETYGLSVKETARDVLVSEQTITRWMNEATEDPDSNTIRIVA